MESIKRKIKETWIFDFEAPRKQKLQDEQVNKATYSDISLHR